MADMRLAAVAEMFRRLRDANPHPTTELEYASPFQLLVAVVLSAQSTDKGVNIATRRLFALAPTPEAMMDLGEAGIAEQIKTIGLYRNKAKNTALLSRLLVERHGGEVPNDRAALEALPGVGRKTANVVLGNAFGVPGVTPDTHLIRVSGRLGWTTSTKPDDVERDVGALFPPRDWVMVCHRVIWHGRRCCHARRPACGACPVRELCPSRDVGEQDPERAAALIREPRG